MMSGLQYWLDITECVCDSDTPIGACLKCDLEELAKKLKDRETVTINFMRGTLPQLTMSQLKRAFPEVRDMADELRMRNDQIGEHMEKIEDLECTVQDMKNRLRQLHELAGEYL